MIPITERLLDNYNRPGRKIKKLKAIIIHWTANANRGANAMANRNYFNTKPYIYTSKDVNTRKIVYASAHYVVDDHMILRCLPEDEVGYHVGAKAYKELVYTKLGIPRGDTPNNYTIGIEICVNADGNFNIARANTIELTRALLHKYNLTTKDVFRHFDITGKDCPRMMLDENIWRQFLSEVDHEHHSIKVNTAELRVRKGPGTSFDIVRSVKMGDVLEVFEKNTPWLRIGDNEWVHEHYVLTF